MTPIDLIAWRRAHKVNQAKLAELLDVSRETVGRWERGIHPIPDAMASRIFAINPAVASAALADDAPLTQENWWKWRKLHPEAIEEARGEMFLSRAGVVGPGAWHPRAIWPTIADPIPWSFLLTDEYYEGVIVQHRRLVERWREMSMIYPGMARLAEMCAKPPTFPLAIPPDTEE